MQKQSRKGFVDVNYEPKMSMVRKKPLFPVKMEPTKGIIKLQKREKHVCSKGENYCKISNNRLQEQIKKLSAMSPKIDEHLLEMQMAEEEERA